jgi:hypothetical protein
LRHGASHARRGECMRRLRDWTKYTKGGAKGGERERTVGVHEGTISQSVKSIAS